MIIRKTNLPEASILQIGFEKYDYVDSFESSFIDPHNSITSTDIGKAFFKSGPKWVESLFTFRNKIASAVGLKTPGDITDRQKQLDNFKCEAGERLGLFKVFNKTENEVILGEDDKHLNFRVSLFLSPSPTNVSKKHLTISTTVEFNNFWGRLYFFPVKPFHTFIVPTLLKGMIREVNTELSKTTTV